MLKPVCQTQLTTGNRLLQSKYCISFHKTRNIRVRPLKECNDTYREAHEVTIPEPFAPESNVWDTKCSPSGEQITLSTDKNMETEHH